jgi:hypothetical protein
MVSEHSLAGQGADASHEAIWPQQVCQAHDRSCHFCRHTSLIYKHAETRI